MEKRNCKAIQFFIIIIIVIEKGKFGNDMVRSYRVSALCVDNVHIFVCSSESVCVKNQKHFWHLCCGAPARSRRASAQTCWLPQGPAGSHTTPTQAPAVKNNLLTRLLCLTSLSVLSSFFYFASPGSPRYFRSYNSFRLSSSVLARYFSAPHSVFPSSLFPRRGANLSVHSWHPQLWRTRRQTSRQVKWNVGK